MTAMIPPETIAASWNRLNLLPKDAFYPDLKRLHQRQPLLMRYLQLTDEDEKALNEKERQMLYYLGMFVVKVMLDEYPNLPEVTPELLTKVQDSNIEMLKFIEAEETADGHLDSVAEVIMANPQAPLLGTVYYALMNDPVFTEGVREENVWQLFVRLKIALDCLNKVE